MNADRSARTDDAAPGLEVVREADDAGAVVLRVSGEIDLATLPVLSAAMDKVLAETPAVLHLEVSAVDFMDSSGIAQLLQIANDGPAVRLLHPSEAVRQIIELSGLKSILPVIS